MADLQAMFQNIGPTSASLMNGIQQGQAYNANEAEQAYKQAAMEKIMQETAQAQQMNPLEIQAKKQAIAAGELKAKQDQDAYRDEVLGKAIPKIAGYKGPERYAAVDQIFAQAGLPLDESDKQHLFSLSPDDLLKELKAKHEWSITQNKGYRQAMDVAEMQRKSAEKIAGGHDAATKYAADQRAQTAKDRATAAASDAAMMTKLAGNYAGQQAYYEKKARDAYNSGDDSQYLYYTSLRDKAKQQELDKAAAGQNARANADAARLEALGGNSVIVRPPANLSISQKRDAL